MWLFDYEGANFSVGHIAEWDPEIPLGIAIIAPSGADISDDEEDLPDLEELTSESESENERESEMGEHVQD